MVSNINVLGPGVLDIIVAERNGTAIVIIQGNLIEDKAVVHQADHLLPTKQAQVPPRPRLSLHLPLNELFLDISSLVPKEPIGKFFGCLIPNDLITDAFEGKESKDGYVDICRTPSQPKRSLMVRWDGLKKAVGSLSRLKGISLGSSGSTSTRCETDSDEEVPGIIARVQDEGQAGPNPGEHDEVGLEQTW
ncbi:hypothetical protein Tco_1219237 [Tanacetum coccineum]